MKRILTIILTIGMFSACTLSQVEFDVPSEIGFAVAANNMTKAAVAGSTLSSDVHLMVFAETSENTSESADYLSNAEFKLKGNNLWGGWKNNAAYPYYWPNERTLHFAGYTKSGNVTLDNTSYNCQTGVLTISNYSPGTSGANDLMWFPSTELTNAKGYGKTEGTVPVNLYHTCSWITFMVVGDDVTGSSSNDFKVTSMTMLGVDHTADLTCRATNSGGKIVPTIQWSKNTDQTGENTTYSVAVKNRGTQIMTNPLNVETGEADSKVGNVVLIPQKPGKLNLVYTYTNPAGTLVTDHVSGLELAISTNEGENFWNPGRHYIYTIEIRADKVIVVPTLTETWGKVDGDHDLSQNQTN